MSSAKDSPLSTSSAAFQCDFLCGFAGSFEMVSAHETNCALNPALSSDVSTNTHVHSSTHSPDSTDTPMNTLEIINLGEHLRTSDFEQFEKAGTQTPPKKVVAHHLPTPRSFAVSRPRSFAVPGLAVLGMKTSPRDGTGRKPAKQVCELCRKLMPPLTTEATTVHEQVEAGVGEPCANKIKSSAVCARTGLIRLHFYPCHHLAQVSRSKGAQQQAGTTS